MASKPVKSVERGSKRKKELETGDEESLCCSTNIQDSDPFDSSDSSIFEKVIKDMNKEMDIILAKYAQIFGEKRSVDASYIQELDEILKEARATESQLKQKRESLRNRLTMIATTLQK
ncbi:testis-expressed protein 12 [Microcaecilia unicolor]|uniref:Testis-expressed protein 12 n=1 Tax=Microcaecilia unicolor TaxID=1415580 RepID=A0A6P7ZHR2_9AMPH|nr:testis-expressed protein 12 [Microcaecilia unicolor]XP_030077287.1 testis-expressed protein 12 [Microcaecilia unicolor]XP_030077288.1 testis-expressed protein 12 [Microcaecilia unicolor]